MTNNYRVATGAETLALLSKPGIDLTREVILEKEPQWPPQTEPAEAVSDDSAVEIVKLGVNEITIKTSSVSPSILVLSEIYYPDWLVEVDGEPAELLKANYIIRAVSLESGDHEVVFRYDMSLLKRSAYISAGAFGLVSLILMASLVLTMRGRRGGSTHRRTDV
jgi:hypothetical protein